MANAGHEHLRECRKRESLHRHFPDSRYPTMIICLRALPQKKAKETDHSRATIEKQG
jgi:hypothetical protein